MMWAKVFPATTMTLNVLAAVSYGFNGDWRRAVYWAAAAVLTASVTF